MALSIRLLGAIFLLSAISAVTAQAQSGERQTLGTARLLTNDTFGDGRDRWRTGGYGASVFRGQEWSGELPTRFGAVMEYRLRGDVIAPDNITNPDPNDRLYAGTWWLGAHSHFAWQGFEVTAGADLVITGEQSGIRGFQSALHDTFSMPSVRVENVQVDDAFRLHGTVELARSLQFAAGELRPFVELQAGAETLARAGFDLTLGQLGNNGLRARDPSTGQRIAAINGPGASGWSFLLGADFALVESSIFLPEDRGPELEETRHRLRAGVNRGFGDSNIFYGVTYHSEEFVGQDEGQVVGSLSVDLRF